MPATYTHFRFGQDVKQRLPKRLRKIVDLHEDLFDIGLYGPDILFYYHAAVANPVSLTGCISGMPTGSLNGVFL